jgi:hypothetical protein
MTFLSWSELAESAERLTFSCSSAVFAHVYLFLKQDVQIHTMGIAILSDRAVCANRNLAAEANVGNLTENVLQG